MKITLTLVISFGLLCTALAESPSEQKNAPESGGDKPFKVGSTYVIAFSPVIPTSGIDLPNGPSKVVSVSGDWVRIEYSSFKNERDKSDPGLIVKSEKVFKAWVNLEHIVAFVDADEAKAANAPK